MTHPFQAMPQNSALSRITHPLCSSNAESWMGFTSHQHCCPSTGQLMRNTVRLNVLDRTLKVGKHDVCVCLIVLSHEVILDARSWKYTPRLGSRKTAMLINDFAHTAEPSSETPCRKPQPDALKCSSAVDGMPTRSPEAGFNSAAEPSAPATRHSPSSACGIAMIL